jgi:hypothetical protein
MNRTRTAIAYFSSAISKAGNAPADNMRRCLIAKATYGSELSSEAQLLRSFRDDVAMCTFAGRNFTQAFNSWYYSFSPSVTQTISRYPVSGTFTREVVNVLLI